MKSAFNGVKVFTTTMVAQRHALGDTVTRWLEESRKRPGFEVVDIMVRQSSDQAFHCVTIIIFTREPVGTPTQKKTT